METVATSPDSRTVAASRAGGRVGYAVLVGVVLVAGALAYLLLAFPPTVDRYHPVYHGATVLAAAVVSVPMLAFALRGVRQLTEQAQLLQEDYASAVAAGNRTADLSASLQQEFGEIAEAREANPGDLVMAGEVSAVEPYYGLMDTDTGTVKVDFGTIETDTGAIKTDWEGKPPPGTVGGGDRGK